jgi:hypothetical protein
MYSSTTHMLYNTEAEIYMYMHVCHRMDRYMPSSSYDFSSECLPVSESPSLSCVGLGLGLALVNNIIDISPLSSQVD